MDSYKVNEIVNLTLGYYDGVGESMKLIARIGWRVIGVDQKEITIRYDKGGRLLVMTVNEKYLSRGFI